MVKPSVEGSDIGTTGLFGPCLIAWWLYNKYEGFDVVDLS